MTKRFTPVRDPITGRLDMVPYVAPEWGDRKVSEPVRAEIGHDRYDTLYPEGFDGVLRDAEHLHDATIVEITSMMAPHADEGSMGRLIRQWRDAARLVRDGTLGMATVAVGMHMDDLDDGDDHGGVTYMIMNVTVHEVVLTVFCDCGAMKTAPITYWSDAGAFSTNQVDDEAIDHGMIDLKIQMRRRDDTVLAVTAARKLAEQPAGVVDMAAYRVLRAMRG